MLYKNILLLLVSLALPALLFSQQLFIQKKIDAPGTHTVGPKTRFADLDHDGDEDLVGTGQDGASLLVYLNQNGAIDTVPQRIATNLGKSNIEYTDFFITDWNLDGLPDWVQVQESGKFYLLINQGGLAFADSVFLFHNWLQLQYGVSYGVKDLNADGYPDFYYTGGDPFFYLNNGGQPSVTKVPVTFSGGDPTAGLPNTGTFLDYDGDGVIDFVGAWGSTFINDMSAFKGVGNFVFVWTKTIWNYNNVIQGADLDNDGADEVITGGSSGNLFALAFDNSTQAWNTHTIGNPAFTPYYWYCGCPYISWQYPMADMDGNGFVDIVRGNSVFFNNGNFQFSKQVFDPNPNFAGPHMIVGDPDGDGQQEIWWATEESKVDYLPSGVFSVEVTAANGFSPRERKWRMYPYVGPHVFFDCNNDEDLDMAYFTNGHIALSINHGGVFAEKPVADMDCAFCFTTIQAADLDGDGYTDLLVYLLNGINRWYRNTGNETFELLPLVLKDLNMPFSYPYAVPADDIDGDGLQDLFIWSVNSTQEWAFLKNMGGGNFQTLTAGKMDFSHPPTVVASDFNSDGLKDFVVLTDASFGYVFLNDKGAGFTQSQVVVAYANNTNGAWAGLADMTADGKKDIVYSIYPGKAYQMPGKGDGTFGPDELLEDGDVDAYAYGAFSLADVNNDGLEDWIGNLFYLALNDGSGFGTPVYQGDDQSGQQVLDMDNDGDLDITRFHNPGLFWENTTNGSSRIFGKIFFDTNGNGLEDPGEHPAAGLKTGIETLQSFAVTDSAGRFSIPTGSAEGQFNVAAFDAQLASFEFTTAPYPPVASVSKNDPADTVLIGLRVIGGATATLDQALSNHRCGETGRLWIDFNPLTPGPADGELRLKFPAGLTWLSMDSLPGVTVTGNEIRWPLSQLASLQRQNLWADFTFPGFQSLGDTLVFTTELVLHSGAAAATIRDTLRSIVTCAYDPNDKLLTNTGQFLVGEEYFTRTAPDRVEYTVRFQNTGNDTASQVVVLDNISSVFDYGSFQPQGASHPYRANLDGNGLLRVEFANIALPDSAADFTGSMGYFKFSIGLKPDPPRDKAIVNGARILFDQNPPVHTNATRFRIIDCGYFAQGIRFPDLACEGDSVFFTLPTHGLVQTFAWTHNDIPVSQSDTAWMLVTGVDNVVGLHLENALCQFDTAVYFHSNGGYPELLLSIDSSISICAGTPVEITSNRPLTEWFRNDSLVNIGSSYSASTTQHLTVTSGFGTPCVTKKDIDIYAAEIPTPLITAGGPNIPAVRCPGDSVIFSTPLVVGRWQWLLYDQTSGLVDSSRASVFGFPIDFAPNAYIRLTLDTLNCSLAEERNAMMIPEGVLGIAGDSVLCPNTDYGNFYPTIDENYVFADSFFVYQGNALISAQYFSTGFFVQPISAGEYRFEVFAACNHDTILRTIYDFTPFTMHIEVKQDSLATNNGQPAIWFYAPSAGDPFVQITDNVPFLAQPATGYYFLFYQVGNCTNLSDTVFFHNTGLIQTPGTMRVRIYPNPNAGVFTLDLSTLESPDLSVQIRDVAGRIVFEKRIDAPRENIRVEYLPAGVYCLRVMEGSSVWAVERWVKQ